ncbi:hypothetical protein DVH24_026314 [Malus domestica]|uniref:Uncharacterized protein n=1 Tax=Malus domestica TaxID=3750 RepID=A0A498KHK4_MALDO|nr:hypothetical protein DVH24_026314 [Malus domestica]
MDHPRTGPFEMGRARRSFRKKREGLEKYLDLAKEKKMPEPSERQPIKAYSFKTIVDRIAEKMAKQEPTLAEIVQILELYHFSPEKEVQILETFPDRKCAYKGVGPLRGVDCEIPHRLRRGSDMPYMAHHRKNEHNLALARKDSTSIQRGCSLSSQNPNPISYALPYNKGKEKAVTDNPFICTMVIPLMNIGDSDLLSSPRSVGEKYHRYHICPFLKPRYWYERLLLETESVNVVHRYKSETNNMIAFSKITILKVISL